RSRDSAVPRRDRAGHTGGQGPAFGVGGGQGADPAAKESGSRGDAVHRLASVGTKLAAPSNGPKPGGADVARAKHRGERAAGPRRGASARRRQLRDHLWPPPRRGVPNAVGRREDGKRAGEVPGNSGQGEGGRVGSGRGSLGYCRGPHPGGVSTGRRGEESRPTTKVRSHADLGAEALRRDGCGAKNRPAVSAAPEGTFGGARGGAGWRDGGGRGRRRRRRASSYAQARRNGGDRIQPAPRGALAKTGYGQAQRGRNPARRAFN